MTALPLTTRPASPLFSPFKVRDLSLANRVVMSPMCQYSAVDGMPGAWHQAHYGARMIGGIGLLILESTGISAEGRITHGCLGLWNDEQERAHAALVGTAHKLAVPIGVQLNHAGRKGSAQVPWLGGKALQADDHPWQVLAPSALAQDTGMSMPQAMTPRDIRQVIDAFAASAARAVRAGFDVIELHAAHGYLLHQFLSPLSNGRDDAWGGSLDGRARMLLETIDAVRSVLPAGFPLFVRLSCSDGADEGLSVDDAVHVAAAMRLHGVDLVDCSSGGIAAPLPRTAGVAFNVDASARVRTQAQIATGAVGGIANAAQAESILADGQADLVFLGRALLSDPFWALRARSALGAGDVPVQYKRATF